MKGIVTNERLRQMATEGVAITFFWDGFDDDGKEKFTAVRIGRENELAHNLKLNIDFYCEAGHYASEGEPIDAIESLLAKAGIE